MTREKIIPPMQGEKKAEGVLAKAESEATEIEFGLKSLLNRDGYYKECKLRIFAAGWIKPEQEQELIEHVLAPIFDEYEEVIREISIAIKNDMSRGIDPEDDMNLIVARLNNIMNQTTAFGVIDNDMILDRIYKYCNEVRTSIRGCGEYCDYAIQAMFEKIRNVYAAH